MINHETRKGIAVAHARVDNEGRRTEAEIERLVTDSLKIASKPVRTGGKEKQYAPDLPWHPAQRERMRRLIDRLGLLEPIGHD